MSTSSSAREWLGLASPPRLTYFVCGLPRCGSNLLCTALSGLAGRPDEHFLAWYRAAAAGEATAAFDRAHVLEYLRKVFTEGAADGILGIKIMRDQLDIVMGRIRALSPDVEAPDADLLDRVFPNLRYIHLVRRDVVRQAISLVRARQSNEWYELQPWAAEAVSKWDSSRSSLVTHLEIPRERIDSARETLARRGHERPDLHYDFDAIEQQVTWLTAEDRRWSAFFASGGIHPFRIFYEELADRYEETVRRVLAFLDVAYDERRILPQALKRQSDEINDDWAARFERDRQRRAEIDPMRR